MEGIYISSVYLGYNSDINNCTIKRCEIESIYQSGTHTNTLIDQCVVKWLYAIETGINFAIKNSTIAYFGAINTATNVANITNCYIHHFEYSQPYAVYKNNVIRLQGKYNSSITLLAPSEYYYNYFYCTSTYNSTSIWTIGFSTGCKDVGNTKKGTFYDTSSNFPDDSSFDVKGEDGTPIGITGGEGFNEYPGIPRVLTATIDAQTDDQGKLNASITVKAEK